MNLILKACRLTWKLGIFVVFIISYIAVCLFWRLWTKDPVRRRQLYTLTVKFFCRLALWLMSFKLNAINSPDENDPYLLISNHLGILDILMLASVKPTLFVTSVEMRNTPLLGLLTEMGGCLYVERRDRRNIQNELIEIRETLKKGLSVALYPEGTSSDGTKVLPFKKTLLTSAAGTGVPIKPVIINFRRVNGEPMSHKWREYVFWYGDQTFLGFLFRVFTLKSIEADIEFGEELYVHNEEERRTIAAHLQSLVESKYIPVPLPRDL